MRLALQQITLDDYLDFERYWGGRRIVREGQDSCVVKNPIIGETHEEVIAKARSLPHFFKLSVRSQRVPGKWEYLYAGELEKSQRARDFAARMADEDLRARNYLDVALRKPGQGYLDEAILEFARSPSGLIIGYKVRVRYENFDLFDIERKGNKLTINGIADPECLRRPAPEGKQELPAYQHMVHTA